MVPTVQRGDEVKNPTPEEQAILFLILFCGLAEDEARRLFARWEKQYLASREEYDPHGSCNSDCQQCEIKRLRDALEFALKAPKEIQKIMTDNSLVIDNLDDKMQKLAFTVYSKLVAVADKAERALKEDENA